MVTYMSKGGGGLEVTPLEICNRGPHINFSCAAGKNSNPKKLETFWTKMVSLICACFYGERPKVVIVIQHYLINLTLEVVHYRRNAILSIFGSFDRHIF